jgi:hypothetical protein
VRGADQKPLVWCRTINAGLYAGTWPQDPWTDTVYDYGNRLAYPGLAYVATNYFDLGSSDTPPSMGFEVYGLLDSETPNTYQGINTLSVNNQNGLNQGGDVDPALILIDFLVNPQYGVGFPAQYLDCTSILSPVTVGANVPNLNDSSYQTYCYAQYLAMSPLLTDQETASSRVGCKSQIPQRFGLAASSK